MASTNEGHVKAMILKQRAKVAARYTPPQASIERSEPRVTPERAAAILAESNFDIEANLAKPFPKAGVVK